jgi:hypothetical protein
MHTPFTLWMNFSHVQMTCITDLYECIIFIISCTVIFYICSCVYDVFHILLSCDSLKDLWNVYVFVCLYVWLMPYAYLLVDASCTLPLLFSRGSIVLIEHFLNTDSVTVLLTSRGLYIKLLLCSLLLSYFISGIPRRLTCYAVIAVCLMLWVISVNIYHVTSHFFTWEKMPSFFVSLWPCSIIRKRAQFTTKHAAFHRIIVHGRQAADVSVPPPTYLSFSTDTEEKEWKLCIPLHHSNTIAQGHQLYN